MSSIAALPPEVLWKVYENLTDVKDLVHCSETSRFMHESVHDFIRNQFFSLHGALSRSYFLYVMQESFQRSHSLMQIFSRIFEQSRGKTFGDMKKGLLNEEMREKRTSLLFFAKGVGLSDVSADYETLLQQIRRSGHWIQDLRHKCSEVPAIIDQLSSLKRLDLAGSSIQRLPCTFGFLQKLSVLNLSNCALRTLPDSFCGLSSLQILYLQGNQLSALPENFGALHELSELNLLDNELTQLPKSFCELTALKVLDLSLNQLSHIQLEWNRLKSLKILRLLNNRLREIPDEVGELTALESLDIGNNLILSDDHNHFDTLPNTIKGLQHLQELNIQHVGLKAFPKEIGSLTSLRVIKACHNELRELPKSVKRLTQLNRLLLSFNQIDEMPQGMKKMKKLQMLYIDYNRLKEIPDLSKTEIESLNCCHNDITRFPEWFPTLQGKCQVWFDPQSSLLV